MPLERLPLERPQAAAERLRQRFATAFFEAIADLDRLPEQEARRLVRALAERYDVELR